MLSIFTRRDLAWRPRLWQLVPFALLMVITIVLAPAGAAKPQPVTRFEICVQNATGGTATAACDGSIAPTFAGNTVATVQLSVVNDTTSTSSIGSADITVPPQLKVVNGSALPTKYVSSSGQAIQIRGVNLPGGKAFVATFQVYVACGGQALWKDQTQSAWTSSDGTGTSFGYVDGTGDPSTITAACHLAFVNQPTDTVTGQTIKDSGASTGDPVTVGLFDESGNPMTSCPVGYVACGADVSSTPSGVTGTTTRPLSAGLVATFDDLSITNSALATQYRLTATGDGGFAPTVTSGSFLVADTVNLLDCTGGHCSGKQQPLHGQGLADSFADVAGVENFNFMTLSPFTLTATPQGCGGVMHLGVTGFAESDSRLPGSGALTIRYYVDKDILQARYGKNVGNQFVPLCVGGRPVDPHTGTIDDCTKFDPVGGHSHGWFGDAISSSTGKFIGGPPVQAVCNSDGYYWGIISSYQDKLDATTNPVVANWGGTQIGGANYRFFDMSIPENWDWRAGPG